MSGTNLMDIEPGGENTQYESIRLFTETPKKQTGQLGGHSQHTISEMRTTLGDDRNGNEDQFRDTPLARQLEKGEATSGLTGITDIDLKPETPEEGAALAAKIRREQGYGPGSGVGA
ncbi:hypothetical protein AbraIFM66951_006009 [Aspergillus brasiliensis]|uniref:Uncharacterized protein n=2 Tax=Aspergillus brasiliensis TaxID=319629 RepID=A0A1L9UX96_ASPBC|nr:hypothetical protein ASPBRDRAFT_192484 [Aspergillus brasiliensis CBS 101740]GKZ17055.1 hypothetical protein AbraCBS73388_006043 [Aspergillus brasiliensis]GKZ44169.1 hypothetical protein AbraIFM66951_006009 [Aspergillus brasiliensis]